MHVVIVGAGIVGAAAAWRLASAGARVTVLEAIAPAAGATGAADGAISVATKSPGRMMRLAQAARDLYGRLAEEGPLQGLFIERPTLQFARTQDEVDVLAQHARDLAEAGEPVHPLTRAELEHLVPGIGASVHSGLAVPRDGLAIGFEVTARLLAQPGITVRRNASAQRLLIEGGRVCGVALASGPVSADRVLVAAGLGSTALLDLPEALTPRKGQMIVTDRAVSGRPAICGLLSSAAYLIGKRAAAHVPVSIGLTIDPLRTGQFLIGGTREEGREDRTTDARLVAAILAQAIDVYPPLAHRRVVRTFAGVRTASRDGLPIVGRHPAWDGVVVATGFEGDGICLGPLMGFAVADLLAEREPSVDLAPFSPARLLAERVRA
jgi:glycine/D-amino acid oxidase-like deaminating enzyme